LIAISYKVTGVEEARRSLAQIRLDALQGEVAAILDDMAAQAGSYPAPPPGSTYQRTNALHDGWLDSEPVFDLQADTLLATLTNPAPYGPYVQGAEDQASVHQGRWQTVESLMDEWEGKTAERLEAALMQKVGM
jgi:hypothetical protein